MCGRFGLLHSWAELQAAYRLAGPAVNLPVRYNIAPTQGIVAVNAQAGGTRTLQAFEWGLVPSWAKERRAGPPLINARGETIAEKPAFRAAFRRRRCLIPVSGFYEWQATTGSNGGKAPKQPFWIAAADGGLMSFAGLWEQWLAPDGSEVLSCAIVTTEANDALRPIHHRMPVIVAPDAHEAWLDCRDETATAAAAALLRPASDALLAFHPVARDVNNVRHDAASLIEETAPRPPETETAPATAPAESARAAGEKQGDLFS